MYNMAKYYVVVKELSISCTISTLKTSVKTLKCRKGQGCQKVAAESVGIGSILILMETDHA